MGVVEEGEAGDILEAMKREPAEHANLARGVTHNIRCAADIKSGMVAMQDTLKALPESVAKRMNGGRTLQLGKWIRIPADRVNDAIRLLAVVVGLLILLKMHGITVDVNRLLGVEAQSEVTVTHNESQATAKSN
jgi:hypothetical protein